MTDERPVTSPEIRKMLDQLTALSFRATLAGQRELVDQLAPAIGAIRAAETIANAEGPPAAPRG